MSRYEIRYGRFGAYFYDSENKKELDLNEVLNILNKSKIEFIARIRHLGWICYQIAAKQPYNVDITTDQLESLRNGVEFALNNPNMTSEENHNNWMEMKLSQGWKYGEVKDLEKKSHPDLVPFEDLPEIEKLKDLMDNLMNKEAEKLWRMFHG